MQSVLNEMPMGRRADVKAMAKRPRPPAEKTAEKNDQKSVQESVQESEFTLEYWCRHQLQTSEHESLQEAINFGARLEAYEEGAPHRIKNPDGSVALEGDELDKVCWEAEKKMMGL